MSHAIPTEADLYNATLTGAYLGDADLTDANIEDADLTSTSFLNADLIGADLTLAILRKVPFNSDSLQTTTLDGNTSQI
jgi:uncharacterized protein YjbI with pentapeptide repeats